LSERPADRTDALRVSVLSEALPYIQRFSGRRVVVKYGGAAMVREDLRDAVYRDLVLLASVGVKPVVVHGGGPEINEWLGRLNIEPQFRNGLRVTCPDTMDVVEMVLVGRVNKQIVNGLNRLGARAVGLSGSDGPLVRARTYGDGANGLVGDVAAVDPSVLFPLLDAGYIPVISSVAADGEGQAHNINADTVAGVALAAGALLVPVEDATDEGGDQGHPGFGGSDRLGKAEEQRQVAVNALLLQDLGGFDAFPGGGDLDEDAIAADAGLAIEADQLAGFGDRGFGVKAQAGIDLGGDAAGPRRGSRTSHRRSEPGWRMPPMGQ